MRNTCIASVRVMEEAFQRFELQVPAPQLVAHGSQGYVYRYVEQTVFQALILKLARLITGLYALDALLLQGFLQEAGCTQRVLDEVAEDIYFLAASVTNGDHTEKHERYLVAFWGEQFPDPDNTLAPQKKPDTPRRNKIVGYVHSTLLGSDGNTSEASSASEIVSSTYSGFIHARAAQVMDLYGGEPPRFHLHGMVGTPRMDDAIHDAWNYFYRALMAFTAVAKAFGDLPMVEHLFRAISKFLMDSGSRGAEDLTNHLAQQRGNSA